MRSNIFISHSNAQLYSSLVRTQSDMQVDALSKWNIISSAICVYLQTHDELAMIWNSFGIWVWIAYLIFIDWIQIASHFICTIDSYLFILNDFKNSIYDFKTASGFSYWFLYSLNEMYWLYRISSTIKK